MFSEAGTSRGICLACSSGIGSDALAVAGNRSPQKDFMAKGNNARKEKKKPKKEKPKPQPATRR